MNLLNTSEILTVAGGGFNLGQEIKNLGGGAEDAAKKLPEIGKKVGQEAGNFVGSVADKLEQAGDKLLECDKPKNDICSLCDGCSYYTLMFNDGRPPITIQC